MKRLKRAGHWLAHALAPELGPHPLDQPLPSTQGKRYPLPGEDRAALRRAIKQQSSLGFVVLDGPELEALNRLVGE
jgi:hypothetical protein